MDEDTPSKNEEERKERIVNAQIGYQVAVSLAANEVRAMWSRFSAILTANGIIIGVIGWSLNSAITKEEPLLMRIPIVMSIFGIILCILWYFLMARKQQYHLYLIISARELEQDWLNDPIRTLARGARLTGDKALKQPPEEVSIKLGPEHKTIKMRWWEKVKTKTACNGVILLFGILYLVSLLSLLLGIWVESAI